jgi:hypothetical protein
MLNSERYRQQAADMREKAERADDQVVRNGYLELASHYDFMADYFERIENASTEQAAPSSPASGKTPPG